MVSFVVIFLFCCCSCCFVIHRPHPILLATRMWTSAMNVPVRFEQFIGSVNLIHFQCQNNMCHFNRECQYKTASRFIILARERTARPLDWPSDLSLPLASRCICLLGRMPQRIIRSVRVLMWYEAVVWKVQINQWV